MMVKFDKKVDIKYHELAHDLTLKPSALFHFLEDLASENAEMLGFGYSFVRKNNLAWVLLKYHMEFESYPQNIQEITIKTEARGCNRLFAFRDFEIFSNQKRLGKIISTWSLIDMNTRNIAPASMVLKDNPYIKPFEKRENDLNYEKIKPLNKIDAQKIYEIQYDDIDVNLHVNNSSYIIWAFEPLSFEFRNRRKLKSLDLVYKKEIKYGSKVISKVEINENQTNHILKSMDTDEDLCMICASWCDK